MNFDKINIAYGDGEVTKARCSGFIRTHLVFRQMHPSTLFLYYGKIFGKDILYTENIIFNCGMLKLFISFPCFKFLLVRFRMHIMFF